MMRLADQLRPPYYWRAVERLIHARCRRRGLLVGNWPKRVVERERERFEMRLMTAVMPEAR